MRHLLITLVLLMPVMVSAGQEPAKGPKDSRVRFVDYDPTEVVEVYAHYGYATHIQFANNEHDIKISIGDQDAWDIATFDNHIFLKPKAKDPNTNMTVLTSRRAYNFDLIGHKRPKWPKTTKDMMYQVSFNYPQDVIAANTASIEKQKLSDALASEETNKETNWDYWIKGSDDISPSRVYDDNRFTYLEFAGAKDMPAIYMVGQDGSESLVNTHVKDNTIVVHKVARSLTLRKGNLVVCLQNRSYDPVGIATPSGSADPDIKRIIKQVKS